MDARVGGSELPLVLCRPLGDSFFLLTAPTVETVGYLMPSLKGLGFYVNAYPALRFAACWAKLCRACGAVSCLCTLSNAQQDRLHRVRRSRRSFVTLSNPQQHRFIGCGDRVAPVSRYPTHNSIALSPAAIALCLRHVIQRYSVYS